MDRTLTYTVTEEYAGMELLAFLRKKGFSRRILTSMKPYENALLRNQRPIHGRDALQAGDLLQVFVPETEKPHRLVPSPIPLSVLYEDQDLLVVDKPAHMPVHPAMGNHENTLANAAAAYFQDEPGFVFRCVNRLDRDTTGALILAKNPFSASVLSADMKRQRVRRTYLALVQGTPPLSGTIDAPISRKEGSALLRRVNLEHGERAVTHFQRLAAKNGCSLVELHLETGRTHQIRVHMKHLGFPLPGDYLYHPDYSIIDRQPLHSLQLDFLHPVTRKPLCIMAPLPQDFAEAFRRAALL
ncbi:MAG: RluA family pseudouridine synthase [Eubacteriales bacterium]|nr:RluA family pseudouridine synthase [Eubacteriales bacterium]